MRRWFRVAQAILAAGAIAGALAACGGDEEDDAPSEPASSVARFLPDSSPVLNEVDLAQARDQLGLPEDADALDFEAVLADDFDPQSPEGRLISAANVAMPDLTLSVVQTLEPDPIAEAFDGTAITEAANTNADEGQITAIRTTQPFEELADALAQEGYERDGEVLSNPDARIGEIADTGEGVIVLGSSGAPAADAAAEAPGGPPELVDLLAPADQPIAQGIQGAEEGCLTAFGGWENVTGTEGVVRIELEDEAEADRVDTGQLKEYMSATMSDPETDGNAVEVPFTAEERSAPGSPVRDVLVNFAIQVYDCG